MEKFSNQHFFEIFINGLIAVFLSPGNAICRNSPRWLFLGGKKLGESISGYDYFTNNMTENQSPALKKSI